MFNRVAALDIVPLLSRIALALLLVPSGWTLLTDERIFTGDEYEMLESLGVIESPDATPAAWRADGVADVAADVAPGRQAAGQALEQAEPVPAGDAASPPARPLPAPPESSQELREQAEEASAGMPATAERPVSGETEGVSARRLYELAITFASAGWPRPSLLAWAAAIFSLLGGSLLLLGLVTRLWSLLAASLFASLFWIESAPIVASAWMFGLDPQQSALVASQGALFVLALGLLLTGGGAASLDRAIFRSAADESAAA